MNRQRKSLASLFASAFRGSSPRPIRRGNPLWLESLESREVPATFTVESALDTGGAGTLRWAIDQANALPGHDTIAFGFDTPGVHTIRPLSQLPWITDRVTIDGYTQAGSSRNTLPVGSDAVLNIELDGSQSGGSGLILVADGSTVQGLVVNNFPGYGIFAYYSDSNVITGNFIGTDPSGNLPRPNDWGIKVSSGRFNVIGGPGAADRNIVSGNKYDGINLQGTYNPSDFQAIGNRVENNYAGTNAAGDAALPNGSPTSDGGGISVGGGSGNFVIGNLISGNDDGGLSLGDWNSTVQGNKIGTDATGTFAIPNTGNLYYPQYGNGIGVYGLNNTIGGDAPGEGNLIAFNAGAGVYVTIHASYDETSATIRGNSIHSNGGLGIDIAPEAVNARGPNANDTDDLDAGPNGYQNFPLLAAASSGGSGTVVMGTLNGSASTDLTLDFYASPVADPSGHGEGKLYLGSAPVTTDGDGDASFAASLATIAPLGWFVSATATGSEGTSEFSGTTTVVAGSFVVNTNDSGPGSLRQAILNANANSGPDTIRFDMYPDDPNHVYYADDGIAGQVSAANITVTSATSDSHIGDLDPDHPHSWWSIRPISVLPRITGTTTIDGYTQPGSSVNTGMLGLNTVLKIELNGSLAPDTATTGGLFFDASNSGIRGLSVNSYYASQVNTGVLNRVTDFVVEGSYIGVDPSGLLAGTTQGRGLSFFIGEAMRVGTNSDGVDDAAERNIVSGATQGISFHGGFGGDVVAGNLIGTDRTGTRAIPNTNAGIVSNSAGGILVGGTTPAARNVISGNAAWGIQMVLTESVGNRIQGNYIGVDVTGVVALGNNVGISMDSNRYSDLLVGGVETGAGNIISGNRGFGISLGTNSNATVQGNFIGADASGTLDIGNKIAGILLVNDAVNNQIGGFDPGAGNLIAFNGPGTLSTDGDGIRVTGTPANNRIEGNTITGNSVSGVRVSGGTGALIRGNSIHSNGGLGINLHAGTAAGGVTANDLDDLDAGPNGYQNFPLLAAASSGGSGTVVMGTLNGSASTDLTLDFYASPVADPSGHGEGKLYLGSAPVTTDGDGDASFAASLATIAPLGWFVSATATGSEGTSEFSGTTTVVAGNDAPNDLNLAGGSLFENGVFTLSGSFADADANDKHTVTVNWGDGSSPEAFTLPVGERSFTFDHRYLDDNPTATGADDYHPTVIVSDGSSDVEAGTTVRVTNLAPSNLRWTLTDHEIDENGTTTINVTFDDPGTRDSHRVTIDWGDGAVETLDVASSERSFSQTHTYRDDNPTATPRDSYVVAMSLVDDDGGVATAATSTIYGLKSENAGATVRTRPPVRLFSFNSDGTSFADHGTIQLNGTAVDVDGLAFSPACGLLAFRMIHPTSTAAPTGSQLLSLDPSTAAATPIGDDLTNRVIRGAAFDASDRLWALDQLQDQLLQIDPSSGAILGAPVALSLDGSPYNLGDLTDIAVRDDGDLVVGDGAGASFYTLDSVTGVLTFITRDTVLQPGQATTPPTGIGMTFHGDALFTYDAQGTDDIYRYETANGFARTTVFLNIIPTFNSGQGDLASAARNTRVHVNNLDPVIESIAATSPYGTGLVHLTGTFSDVGALDTHTLTIDWGHGSPEIVTVTDGVFQVTHQYPASSIEPANQYTISATLTDDDTGTDSDLAQFRTSSISGIAYHDADGDGAQDTGEPGLADWIVFVDGDDDGIRDADEPWTTTGGSGEYALGELLAGTHHVRLERKPGWTTTESPNVSVGSGDTSEGVGLGAYRDAIIRGVAFDDENGNGRRDSDEIPLGGWTVFLDRDRDGRLDPGEARTVTNAAGEYAFDGIVAGRYRVRIVVPNGWENTSANPVMFTVRASQSGQVFTANFGGTPLPASLSGFVWNDANNNGEIDRREEAIAGAIIELSGVDDRGRTVYRSTRTSSGGHYEFDDLRPGTYAIHEIQPNGYGDGLDEVGSLGGILHDDLITSINVDAGDRGCGYNFGERGGVALHRGQTATIGFWQNKNGQALIKSLDGGPNSTALGNWLASNFGNMYGAEAGANDLTGKTNTQIAAYFITLFKMKGLKLEAQVFATALAVYVTNTDLAGTVATAYGFEVSATGTGAATYNVGCNGAAFGVANNTRLTVLDILRAANTRSSGGVLYSTEPCLRNAANNVFDGINNLGDIE